MADHRSLKSKVKERAKRSPRERSIADTMRKFKHKNLHSGVGKNGKLPPKGKVVMRRRQAIAIALSIASRKYGPYVPKTERGMRNAALRQAGLRRGETRNRIKRKVGLG